jgi:hypothetical protein
MRGMAFSTLAQLMIVVLVLSISVLLVATQFAGLSGDTNQLSQSTGDSVDAAETAQSFALCRTSGGECQQEDCENHVSSTPQGPCPENWFCCRTE